MNNQYSVMLPLDTIFLNHAAVSVTTSEVYRAFEENYKSLAKFGVNGIDMTQLLESWQEIRQEFAKLINGKPEGVVITTSTGSGLHLAAEGFTSRYEEGKNIVISELEFTTNSFLWQKLTKKYDMRLRVLTFQNSGFSDLETLIDRDTVIVALSFVQFSNGYRADLEKIGKLAHDNGALFIVDAIQGLGLVPFDVTRMNVDIVASGSYKWLMGPLEGGYFYIQPELLDEFDSILVSWFGDHKYFNNMHHEFNPWPDAREYQQKASPMFPAMELSLKMINDKEPKKMLDHSLNLQNLLLQKLESAEAYQCLSLFPDDNRSGIISFAHKDAKQIVGKLKDEKIFVSLSAGNIRISPHWHNTIEHIEKVADKLLEFC